MEEKIMTRKELKDNAKSQLRGNWGWAIALFLVSAIFIYIVNDIISYSITGKDVIYRSVESFGSIYNNTVVVEKPMTIQISSLISYVWGILSTMILWGVTYTILKFRDDGSKGNVFKAMFSAFTNGRFETSFLTSLLYGIFLTLWACLLVIPGIVKAYAYAMTPYILKDTYDAGNKPTATEAITKSRELMKGHKAELFVLDLSFIGWWLLGIITLGIGFIWITPYYRQTKANFYRELTNGKTFKKN